MNSECGNTHHCDHVVRQPDGKSYRIVDGVAITDIKCCKCGRVSW